MDKWKDININCDLGEGMGNDAQLMPYLSSCNIACGGHFGDDSTMRAAILLAKQHGVKVGAHPSFPDKKNFGRKEMSISPEELEASILQQVTDFKKICDELEVEMHHIKLHGSLYNLAGKDSGTAKVVLRALEIFKPIRLYTFDNSQIVEQSNGAFSICHEAFIDRSYQDDLSLVSRTHPLSLIESPKLALGQLDRMVNFGVVKCISGQEYPLKAETFCIHGDNKNAIEILEYIHSKRMNNG